MWGLGLLKGNGYGLLGLEFGLGKEFGCIWIVIWQMTGLIG